jgi:hypothetical protein
LAAFELTPEAICSFTTLDLGENREREKRWLQEINAQEFKKALVICGVGHSLGFAFRLQDTGFSVDFCQHLPYEKLCTKRHAE